ncbi:MAG TPA: tRNA (N(6)-L-threonylcarbamoyladenosine(37)-C(2))-methylthiotransferase MtaB [Elusimicrobia bacterium]|nr:MAG: hypothetical protein A2278_03360 [Elusimicrobia bacterium RIFOXYA12_FULL_49_49]OGS10001.1 MAG: hypothetical protein A2204_01490 [Elusimicrobia bacterium RIFOXYA1_FULL_47_7]OGS15600.1 MAG: hypothetical protein A2251_03610 [Elusimicrobia bacterium RIFOXYA2_FULL_47_53]OGS26844.1 MAG: hypothetical protein A2339_07370 [Elusimicrobia bacterium RIFOXYB12_FULL_50_12]OGS30699.1 MAG: hypothetical protein A2323_07415 [Elusimicrobia bacterium RIFOXYB2_FULL_46_23]HBU68892.1 tRNA (N(6)-L-threonylcar
MKAYVHTFGCKVNQYDSQKIKENLISSGYELSDDIFSADLVLLNTCTVTGEADRQARQLLRKTLSRNPGARLYVAGCYAKRSLEELKSISPKIEVYNFPVAGENKSAITEFEGRSRAFVKIQDGCDAFCSYCIVPYVRSQMWSKPRAEVLSEIKQLVDKGYPEVVLSGVRLGKYEGGLPAIIESILNIRGDFRIRLSSLEALEISDELLKLMKSEEDRICRHLHIPLQSGSGRILKAMNRPYTKEQFLGLIKRVKAALPDCSITTDVIVGFPGETEADFGETCAFVREAAFSRLHVFRYSSRPGTKSEQMPGVLSGDELRKRAAVLSDIDAGLRNEFALRFDGAEMYAVKDGGDSCLTSNYIRAFLDNPPEKKLFKVALSAGDGVPRASLL